MRNLDPTWEVAEFFPHQGEWTESAYLALPTKRLVELADGRLEVLPMATDAHQAIVAFLFLLLNAHAELYAPGVVRFSPLPMKLASGKFREPDLLYMKDENKERIHSYWMGADLVMEVVSPNNPQHDRDTKRVEYAQAGIPEYWLVDTLKKKILVYTLFRKKYRLHGEFGKGTIATSKLLPGLCVDVDKAMALGVNE